jgi:hypothetical protein
VHAAQRAGQRAGQRARSERRCQLDASALRAAAAASAGQRRAPSGAQRGSVRQNGAAARAPRQTSVKYVPRQIAVKTAGSPGPPRLRHIGRLAHRSDVVQGKAGVRMNLVTRYLVTRHYLAAITSLFTTYK